ncbi:MAG TPA: NAD(P)H-binding protein [Steroidobacteraceae bacterium]
MWMVTHAAGTIGREVVRVLNDRGVQPRLLVGDPAGLPLAMRSQDVQTADFSNESALAAAFAGVTHLVLITPLDARMPEWHAGAARAARAAGVKRVVQITSLGADPSSPIRLLRWYGEAEVRAAAAGLEVTVLRPAVCMQAVLKHNPDIDRCGRLEAPFRRARWALVDARDVAEVAVRVLESKQPARILELTGPKALDYFEIARQYSRAFGHHVEYRDICSPKARGTLEARGLPPRLVDALIEYWDYTAAEAVPVHITDDVERVLGRPPRALNEFLRTACACVKAAAS